MQESKNRASEERNANCERTVTGQNLDKKMENILVAKGQPNPARIEGDTVYLLTNKGEIEVCVCHYDLVKDYRWSCRENGYVTTSLRRRTLYLHRMILAKPSKYIDHRDGNPRNNRCSNLRCATVQQNHINKPVQRNNTSGIKGVWWSSARNKWIAVLCNSVVGAFDSKEEAALCRARAVKKRFGDFARAEYALDKV